MSRKSTLLLLGCGVLAVALGVVALVVDRSGGASADGATATVVVVERDVPAGTAAEDALAEGRVREVEVDLHEVEVGALRSRAELAGRTIEVPLAAGTQVVSTDLGVQPLRSATVEVPEGTQAVAVETAFTAGGAGYISPGDRVDVMALLDDGAPGGRSTVSVLEDVVVLDVSTEVAPRVAARGGSPTSTTVAGATPPPAELTFLLAIPAGEVTRVVQAAGFHRVYLSLPADGDLPPGGLVTDGSLVGVG